MARFPGFRLLFYPDLSYATFNLTLRLFDTDTDSDTDTDLV